jgi:hypothetical protein
MLSWWARQHSTEVFAMNIKSTQGRDEAQDILEALRQIQDSEELRTEAARDPESVMNRLGLSGVARHAVAFGIAGLLVAPIVARPAGWWS